MAKVQIIEQIFDTEYYLPQTLTTVRIVKDLPSIIFDDIALDIETTGLDFRKDTIEIVTVKPVTENVIYIIPIHGKRFPIKLRLTLESGCAVIAHHAMFDLSFIAAHEGIYCTNVICTRVLSEFYTHQTGFAVYKENGKKTHALKYLLKYIFSIDTNKALAVSNWRGDLSIEQIRYAAIDVLFLKDLVDMMFSHDVRMHIDSIPARVYEKVTGYSFVDYRG